MLGQTNHNWIFAPANKQSWDSSHHWYSCELGLPACCQNKIITLDQSRNKREMNSPLLPYLAMFKSCLCYVVRSRVYLIQWISLFAWKSLPRSLVLFATLAAMVASIPWIRWDVSDSVSWNAMKVCGFCSSSRNSEQCHLIPSLYTIKLWT